MPSFAEFEAEMRPLHNHICMLYDQEMVRLIGVGHDDTDLYYIVQKLEKPRHTFSKDHLMWASAVGHFLSLKECLPADRYAALDDHFERMGLDPTEEFEVTDKCIWDQEVSEPFNYVSKCGRFVITLDVQNPDMRFKLSRRYPDRPDEQDAYIMHGEMFAMERIVSAMIDQISDWEAFQEDTDKVTYKNRFAKRQTKVATTQRKLSDYDALPCSRCDQLVKPTTLKPKNAVGYAHDCHDGIRNSWTIDADGDIKNEKTSLGS